MSKDRQLLEQLIKNWAQSHTSEWTIKDLAPGDDGVRKSGEFFTWLILNGYATIDLLSLVDHLELFVAGMRKRDISSGLFCGECGVFSRFAEPNKEDGGFVCWSCKNSPYH